jgi:hypothetical protein
MQQAVLQAVQAQPQGCWFRDVIDYAWRTVGAGEGEPSHSFESSVRRAINSLAKQGEVRCQTVRGNKPPGEGRWCRRLCSLPRETVPKTFWRGPISPANVRRIIERLLAERKTAERSWVFEQVNAAINFDGNDDFRHYLQVLVSRVIRDMFAEGKLAGDPPAPGKHVSTLRLVV